MAGSDRGEFGLAVGCGWDFGGAVEAIAVGLDCRILERKCREYLQDI